MSRRTRLGIALVCAVAILVFAVTVATGQDDDPESPSGHDSLSDGNRALASRVSPDAGDRAPVSWVSTHERVQRHEALPCTGPKDPINFEVFSAGPSVAGLPLTDFNRRCGGTTPRDEPPANDTTYFYGRCKIAKGATGCAPPLEIQSWPACERALGDYSFEGKPIPYERLPSRGGAEVVEIDFMLDHRIEVYTKSSTVVIFAEKQAFAKKALKLLRFQPIGEPPVTKAAELKGDPEAGLAPPIDGATEGDLQCQS
jgi:hypothetical protein